MRKSIVGKILSEYQLFLSLSLSLSLSLLARTEHDKTHPAKLYLSAVRCSALHMSMHVSISVIVKDLWTILRPTLIILGIISVQSQRVSRLRMARKLSYSELSFTTTFRRSLYTISLRVLSNTC